MRTYRWMWRGIAGLWIALGAAVGVVVLPLVVWVLTALMAVVLWLAASVRDSTVEGAEPSFARNVSLAVAGYFGTIATFATAVFVDLGMVLVLAILAGSSPPAVRWYTRRFGTDQLRPSASSTVSMSDLCLEWLDSYAELGRASSSAARLRVVMARQRCLDELERRDPEGLHAWLASVASADGDPRRFLSDTG